MSRMTEDLPFCVTPIEPSGVPQYTGGRMTATRQFAVACTRAEELGLRAIGKWRSRNNTLIFNEPQLPSYYPFSTPDTSNGGTFLDERPWPFRMIAVGFSIQPLSKCCFNSIHFDRTSPGIPLYAVKNLQDPTEAERYYPVVWDSENERLEADMSDDACKCLVTIQYEEPPWDCTGPDDDATTPNVDIMGHTAIGVERNAGFELYTLPNRNLIWADYSGSANQLKGDSYATLIVPTADITVTWYNIPLTKLCEIETHLSKFRNTVNCTEFTLLSECLCRASEDESCSESDSSQSSCKFEPETVLFVDWDEAKEFRTRGFRMMDTTALRLVFKQKRIVNSVSLTDPVEIVGWNHLYLDASDSTPLKGSWRRVARKYDDIPLQPLYFQKNFNNMFDPTKSDTESCPSSYGS